MIIWILIFSLAIRLIALNQSLWLDEAILAQAVSNLSLKSLWLQYFPSDFNPPLIYLIEWFWGRLFGFSEISLRLPSVIFSLVAIWLVYKISKNKVWPALLLATSPLFLYYSQEARMYSLTVLTVCLSFYALTKILTTGPKKILYVISLILVLLSHYLAWFILPTQLLYVLIYHSKKFKTVFLSQLISLILISPWFTILVKQLNLGQQVVQATPVWSQLAGNPTLKNLSLVLVKFIIGRISIANNYYYLLALIIPVTLTLWLLFKSLIAKKSNQQKIFLFWFFTPLLLSFLISFKLPVLAYFRLLFILPAFYLLISTVASKKILIGFLVLNILCSAIYLFNPIFHREDWRQLAQVIKTNNQTQAPVVIISVIKAPFDYYLPNQSTIDYLELDQVLTQPEFWLIPYAQPIFYPDLDIDAKLKTAGFTQTFSQNFIGDLTLVKYTQSL